MTSDGISVNRSLVVISVVHQGGSAFVSTVLSAEVDSLLFSAFWAGTSIPKK